MKNCVVSILNYNGSKDTVACIDSIFNYEDSKNITVVILDNDSLHDEINYLRNTLENMFTSRLKMLICNLENYMDVDASLYDLIIVLANHNYGFAKGNNLVIKGQLKNFYHVALLNNDTELVSASLTKLCDYLDDNKNVGVATTSIYYYADKRKIWNAGGKIFFGTRKYFTENYVDKQMKKGIYVQDVDYITGCFWVSRCDFLEENGLLTEKFFFGEEDYEFSLRMKTRKIPLRVLFTEKIYHKVGASINKDNKNVYRKTFIHHLNRMIDMKSYYPKLVWNIWRMLASLYFYFLLTNMNMISYSKGFEYIRKLNQFANGRELIDKDFFDDVINGKII